MLVDEAARFGRSASSSVAYHQRASGRRSTRAVDDERLLGRIRGLHAANYFAYGYRRMWKALLRAGEQVPLNSRRRSTLRGQRGVTATS
jgi:helix-turn-helix protein